MADGEEAFAIALRVAQREGNAARRETLAGRGEGARLYEDLDLAHAWRVGWDGADGELERLAASRG